MFEDSSRTAGTYTYAVNKLGGVGENVDIRGSSKNKGESDLQSVIAFAGQADALLVRHRDEDFMDKVAQRIRVPFINGGNGVEDHPMQTLKDLYTFREEYGTIDGMHVSMVGDGRMNRPGRSLLRALTKFEDVSVTIAAPEYMRFPEVIIDDARAKGLKVDQIVDLKEAKTTPSAYYLFRPRREYYLDEHGNDVDGAYQRVLDAYEENGYNVSPKTWKDAHPEANVYHARPYITEIDEQFDLDPRARYHGQEENGKYTNAAVLALVMAQKQVTKQQQSGHLPKAPSRRERPELRVI
jgi:aspartate carbamoyltransferase catalytic subunit